MDSDPKRPGNRLPYLCVDHTHDRTIPPKLIGESSLKGAEPGLPLGKFVLDVEEGWRVARLPFYVIACGRLCIKVSRET